MGGFSKQITRPWGRRESKVFEEYQWGHGDWSRMRWGRVYTLRGSEVETQVRKGLADSFLEWDGKWIEGAEERHNVTYALTGPPWLLCWEQIVGGKSGSGALLQQSRWEKKAAQTREAVVDIIKSGKLWRSPDGRVCWQTGYGRWEKEEWPDDSKFRAWVPRKMELSFIELEKTVMRKFRVKIRVGFWTFGLRYLLDI